MEAFRRKSNFQGGKCDVAVGRSSLGHVIVGGFESLLISHLNFHHRHLFGSRADPDRTTLLRKAVFLDAVKGMEATHDGDLHDFLVFSGQDCCLDKIRREWFNLVGDNVAYLSLGLINGTDTTYRLVIIHTDEDSSSVCIEKCDNLSCNCIIVERRFEFILLGF